MKKTVSVILAFLMLMSIFVVPFSVNAAEGGSNGEFGYVISGKEVIITSYLGTQYNVTVPETIDGCTVTTIGTGVFAHKDASALRSVSLPASVTVLEDAAFTDLSSGFVLYYYGTKTDWDNKVSVGSGNDGFTLQRMRFLYKNTFWYYVNTWGNITISSSRDSVADVTIPDTIDGYTVTEILGYCFDDDWTTKTLWLPDSVKHLGYCSIGECSIEAIRIGSGLQTISQSAFEHNTHLTDIYYNGNEEQWKKIEIEESGNERLKEVTMHYVEEVNSFDVTGVIEPVADEKASFNAVSTEAYSVGTFVWYNVTDGFKLKESDTFEAGKTYRAQIELYPRWGYRFIYDNVSAKINGEKATYSSIPGVSTYNGITIKKEFVCTETRVISNVEITDVVEPKVGETPSTEYNVLTKGVTVSKVVWSYSEKEDDNTTIMKSGEKFEAGRYYSVYFTLSADDGYKFAVNSNGVNTYTATVNGKKPSVYTINSSTSQKESAIKYFFPELSESPEEPEATAIEEISISNLFVPRVGKTLAQTADADGHYTVEGISWYDVYAEKWLSASSVVESGKQYEANIHVRADEGYEFVDYTTIPATINGSPASEVTSVAEEEHGKVLNVRVTYPAFDNNLTEIYEIEVKDVTAPVDGAAIVKSAADGEYFSVQNVSWYDVSANRWMQNGEKFVAGKDYEVNINVRAKDGCEFSTPIITIIATVNGYEATAGKMDFEEINEYLNIRYTFTCAEKTTEPKPTTTEPQPTATEPQSTTTEPQPTATEPQPITTEPQPTATEPQPITTEPQPTATEPQPTTEPETDEPEPERTDISGWKVSGIKNKSYTGKAVKQSVKVTDSGNYAEFTVTYKNNVNVGTATMKIVGIGEYKGSITKTFKITKAKQPMTAKGSTKTVKLAKARKSNQTVKNAITVKNAQGTVTYAKIAKGSSKYLTISQKGVITVKKYSKYKKNTVLKINVKVTAKGNKNYSAGSSNVTVKIKIK